MKKADNKKTILKEKGDTQDIINSVLSVFDESYSDIDDFSTQFQGRTNRETAENIINYVLSNFKYKVDPDGVQWVRTPLRLLQDREADCKSFSIFVCSVLSNLGIKNGFRFVSYTPDKQVTHVYSYFIDEDGKKVIVDTVAQIQKGVPAFEELKYKYKIDYMNKTQISKLSGVDDEIKIIEPTDTEAVIFVKSLLAKSILFQDSRLSDLLKSLIYVLQKYSDSDRNLQVALYSWSSLYISEQETSYSQQIKIIDTFVKNISRNANYTFNVEILESESYKQIQAFLAEYVTPYATTIVDSNNQEELTILKENAFNFLYLYVDKKYLSSTQRQKKKNEAVFLATIIDNTSINEAAALNFIYVFCVLQFGDTPQNVLSKMFKKIPAEIASINVAGVAKLGEIYADPETAAALNSDGTINTNTTSTTSNSANWQTWINTAVENFLKVFRTVKGSSYNNTPVTPVYSDVSTSSNLLNYVLFGALFVGGFLMIKKTKKNKK